MKELFRRALFEFLEIARIVSVALRPSNWRRSSKELLEAGIVPWPRSWEEFTTGKVVVRRD